jgi:hypothetical protein
MVGLNLIETEARELGLLDSERLNRLDEIPFQDNNKVIGGLSDNDCTKTTT